MTPRSLFLAAVSAAFCISMAAPAAAADLLYTLQATATLPSVDTDWDYIKMEPGGNRGLGPEAPSGLSSF